MKVVVDIPEITRICPFCGIEFDQEMLERFAEEDHAGNQHPNINVNKNCSLWCAWLRSPGYKSLSDFPSRDPKNLENIKRVVAKRVASEIRKQKREDQIDEMRKSVMQLVLEELKKES